MLVTNSLIFYIPDNIFIFTFEGKLSLKNSELVGFFVSFVFSTLAMPFHCLLASMIPAATSDDAPLMTVGFSTFPTTAPDWVLLQSSCSGLKN